MDPGLILVNLWSLKASFLIFASCLVTKEDFSFVYVENAFGETSVSIDIDICLSESIFICFIDGACSYLSVRALTDSIKHKQCLIRSFIS